MRLVTTGDLDGLTSALLISTCERIDDVALVRPHLISQRDFAVTKNDILVNLPYHPDCGKWFDNHLLTDARSAPPKQFEGRYAQAASAAHVVYDYYAPRHPELGRFGHLLAETDRLDSAQLALEDVLRPGGYILLGFTLDPRTGLGGEEYFRRLFECLKTQPVEEVLKLPEVQERAARMREQNQSFREITQAHSRVEDNVVFTDFRSVDPVPVGNRFLIYTLFPEVNVSLFAYWAPRPENVALSAGWSIFKRNCKTNLGVLMSLYGGGGQKGAGSCMLAPDRADVQIQEIIATLKRKG
jgi:hypothetical protein